MPAATGLRRSRCWKGNSNFTSSLRLETQDETELPLPLALQIPNMETVEAVGKQVGAHVICHYLRSLFLTSTKARFKMAKAEREEGLA